MKFASKLLLATFPTRIDIPEEQRVALVALMNATLKSTICASLAVKFAHWNVKGGGFHPIHKLFDDIYEHLLDAGDTIAERITALGGVAEGLYQMLGEQPVYQAIQPGQDVTSHIQAVADTLGNVINQYRKASELSGNMDLNTQDVYISLGRDIEKDLYFIEATENG
jgi:starvation-inducible DNA-binding protein